MIDLEKEREAFEKEWTKLGGNLDFFDLRADKMYHLNGKSPHLTLNEQAMTVSAINTALAMYLIQAKTKQSEIDSLKAQLAKYESGEFVMVPKESIGNYYYDECENMYIDDPDSFLSDLWFGDVQEVKRRDYFDLPTQYAANVFTDEDNISWELFDSEEKAEKAAAHCKAMIEAAGGGDECRGQ